MISQQGEPENVVFIRLPLKIAGFFFFFSDGIIWINKYVSFVLSSVFLSGYWKRPTSLTIHFRVSSGPKRLRNQPIWLPCCLPAKEMNGMFMRSLGRGPHSYGNVAAVRALGHEEANVWELWSKLQMIQSLRKMHGAPLVQGCFAED